MDAELGDPAWVFDRSTYTFLGDGAILGIARADGRDGLVRISTDGTFTSAELPFTEFEGLRFDAGRVVVVAAGAHDGVVVLRLDPVTGEPSGVLARSLSEPLDADALPTAEPIAFPTAGGATARALFFTPTNPGPGLAVRSPRFPRPDCGTGNDAIGGAYPRLRAMAELAVVGRVSRSS